MEGYVEREAWILDLAAGKRVLHLGFIGETEGTLERRVAAFDRSFHARLMGRARVVVGVDQAREVVDELSRRGVENLHTGDAENLPQELLSEPFDLIVAGDLIEHLSNPGLMLDGLRPLLAGGGQMVLTTPNALGLPNYLRFVAKKFREGADHTLSFNVYTLTHLLERHGWTIDRTLTAYQSLAVGKRSFKLGAWFLRRSPRFGGTLIVVASPR